MTQLIALFALVLAVLRMAFLGAAAVLALVCLVDWLARSRRISPFGGLARFARNSVDPLLAPVERRVLRAGGNPQHTPWWGLAAVVVGGIVVLSLLEFVLGQVVALGVAASAGPRGILRFIAAAIFGVLQIALLVRVFSSWFPVSPYSRWIRWTYSLTEWLLAPLRRLLPTIGPIDISPIVAYFLLRIVGGFVVGQLL